MARPDFPIEPNAPGAEATAMGQAQAGLTGTPAWERARAAILQAARARPDPAMVKAVEPYAQPVEPSTEFEPYGRIPRGEVSIPETTVTGTPGGGGGGPGAPPLPPEIAGLNIARFSDEETMLNELNTMAAQGTLTEPQRAQAIKDWRAARQSPLGHGIASQRIAGGIEQEAMAGQQTQLGLGAREQEQVAGLASQMAQREAMTAKAHAQRLEAKERGYAQLTAQRDAADKRVREYRVGDSRDAGVRIVHGIAAALGEIGRAMTGGSQNTAANLLQAEIEREIHGQELELDSLKEAGGRARSDLAGYEEIFQNREMSRAALEQRYYVETAHKARAIGAKTQSKAGKAQLETVARIAEMKAQKLDSDLAGLAATAEAERQRQLAAAAASREKAQVGAFEWFEDPDGKLQQRYVKELGGFARNETEATELAKKSHGLGRIDAITRSMEALINTPGTELPLSQKKARLVQLQGALHREIAVESGQGAIAKEEGEKYGEQYKSGTEWTGTDAEAIAQMQTARGVTAASRRIMSSGLTPGVTRYVRDAKGRAQFQAGLVQPSSEQQEEYYKRARGLAGRE